MSFIEIHFVPHTSALERENDRLVYELYELTPAKKTAGKPEEIAIV